MMQTMLSLFGTVILSNSALQLVSAQSSNPVDPHAFMWSDWEHHKSLNLDIPENGSCSQLIDQLECEKHRDCGWNQQSSSCYFAADPDFAPVTDDENIKDNDENPSRMLRGEREMNVVVPEGGCTSIKVQGQCGYYNGCYWVNKVGCLAKVTPKPTSPLPTASPVSCSTITSSSRCNYYDHCLWKKDKNGKWTCFSADDDSVETPSPTKTSKPTSKESTPKPTPKPKPGVEQEVCDYPSGGCASLRGDKNSCGEHSGCAWSTKKRACVNNGKCAKTSPPHSTPRPTIPKQERIKIADMCSTPPTGCQGFRLSECEKYNGCYIAGGICTNRKCNQYDCAIRQLAFDMAVTLLPRCQGKVAPNLGMDDCISELKDVHDGLELNARCGFKFNPGHHDTDGSSKPANLPLRKIYVSIATGDDDKGDGSFSKPYKTIQQGVVAAREFSGSSRAVILRAGTYYVTETVVLGPSDSGLTIAPYENENVIVSGAMPLDGIEWKSYSNKIYVADVSKYANKLGHLSQVYFDDKPATRARHPNADPWSQGLFTRQNTGYFESAESWPPAFDTGPSSVLIKQGIRTQNSRYGRYSLGYGGHSSIFTPPASYWAVRNPVAGGGCMFELPRGVEMRAGHFQGIPTTFKRPTDAYVHAYHIYHWGNWVFRVGSQNGKTLMFQGGGFQEARGSCGKGGSQFYIENMLELLDSKNEFYLDTLENKLYYFPNTTTSDADSIPTAVATVNRRIFQIAGDSSNPVKNVVITGLKIEKTYATWMDPHEVPSAGDWSVTRNAAIFIEGAENAVVHGNSFYHMGGNGVFVSNYARNVKITANRFKYLAASAVLVVGDHRYNTQNPWEMLDPNHPFDTVVDGNIASEIGNVVKQSAGFFQALARGSIVQNNVIFNSERTAVNFNDGYGGDNKVYSNLMFNTVRSTIDHGPFNSWDRQPYIQSHPGSNNQITSEPMMSYVKGNYLLGGYGGIKGIDHDDGSTLWENSYNLLVYGYQKLKGRDQESYKNVAMFPMDFTVFLSEPIGIPSSRLLWHDNIMVTSDSTQPYGFGSDNTCSRSVFQADNNELYVAGTFWANCFGESARSWGVWKGNGQDKGSTIKNKLPSTLEMVLMGYDVLGLDKNGVK